MPCRNTSWASSCASSGLRRPGQRHGVDRRLETLDQLAVRGPVARLGLQYQIDVLVSDHDC